MPSLVHCGRCLNAWAETSQLLMTENSPVMLTVIRNWYEAQASEKRNNQVALSYWSSECFSLIRKSIVIAYVFQDIIKLI